MTKFSWKWLGLELREPILNICFLVLFDISRDLFSRVGGGWGHVGGASVQGVIGSENRSFHTDDPASKF